MHILALSFRRELKQGLANSPLNYTSKDSFFCLVMARSFYCDIAGKTGRSTVRHCLKNSFRAISSLQSSGGPYFHGGSALIKINFFQFSVIGALPEFSSTLF